MKAKHMRRWDAFTLINGVVMVLLAVIMLYPILNVAAVSMSSYNAYVHHKMMVFPQEFDFSAYREIFHSQTAMNSLKNSIFVAVVGTSLNMLVTILTAYPLCKNKIKPARKIMLLIVFTMLFSGGMIPTYLVVKGTGILNTPWALILPSLVSTYNLLVLKNFFESIPDSLDESFAIDGAGYVTTLVRLYLPLSVPVLAVVGMFYCVSNWNSFFNAMLYTSSKRNWTIMLFLREMITESADLTDVVDPQAVVIYPKTLQCTAIMVTILPILFVYPFVQRYFVKGAMIGAIKG